MKGDDILTLKLTLIQVNTLIAIIDSLRELPVSFGEVVAIKHELLTQGNDQVAAANANANQDVSRDETQNLVNLPVPSKETDSNGTL